MKKHLTLLLLLVSVCFYGQEAVELEGFYKVNGGEHLFFPLQDSLVSAPFFLRLNEKKLPKSFNNTALIRVKGKKIKKPFFARTYSILYQIEADEVAVSDNNLLLEDYLKKHQVYKTELKEGEERLEYFEKEGYYTGPFEGHTFVWFENEEFQDDAWPFFDENITQNIYVNGERGLGIKSSFNKGIYLKVKGIRTYGKRYGHYVGRESQVNISSVTEIDADKSLWEFIERKIKEKGFYVYKKQKLTFPNILQEGQTYTFKSLAVCDCMLEAKRTGGYINYTFTEKEGTTIKSRFTGRLIAKPWTYDKEPDYNWTDYQVTYESVETENRVYDYSKFTVQVYREKYEDGSIWIAIEDYINDREFGLTEVKN